MNRQTHRTNTSTNWMTNPLTDVRQRMAQALVGQAVSLVDAKRIIRGIVTDVLAEADIPKIVVDGMGYNFNQVLTNVPVALSL